MPQLRVEICSAEEPYAPDVVVGATLPLGRLMTPAAEQPRAPDAPCRAPYFVRFEALEAPAYVAVGVVPDPTREPRSLIVPGRHIESRLVRIRPQEGVAAIIADDIVWTR